MPPRYPCWGYIHSAEHILSQDAGFVSYFRLACAVYLEEMGDMVLMEKKRGNENKKYSLVNYCAPVSK